MFKMNNLYRCWLFLCVLTAVLEFDAAVKVMTGVNTAEPVPANGTVKPRVKKRTGKWLTLYFLFLFWYQILHPKLM